MFMSYWSDVNSQELTNHAICINVGLQLWPV
jgi:hypothetical protein